MRIRILPAFTLTEMLIVLAMSSIVAGLAFAIVSLFGKNIDLIQNNYAKATSVELLEQQLSIDFNKFNTIAYSPQKEELIFKTPIDSMVYRFGDNTILRGMDTLHNDIVGKEMFFYGDPVSSGPIDAMKLRLNSQKNIDLFVYKENDVSSFLNRNGD